MDSTFQPIVINSPILMTQIKIVIIKNRLYYYKVVMIDNLNVAYTWGT